MIPLPFSGTGCRMKRFSSTLFLKQSTQTGDWHNLPFHQDNPFLWIWWRNSDHISLLLLFFLLLCLSVSCAAAVNRIWLPSLWLLLESWLLSLVLVVPSTFVIGSVCSILKRDICPVSLSDMMEEDLLKTFLQWWNSSKLLIVHPLRLTNEVRKRTEELGSFQLNELRLGEISIRPNRFYEIKL